MIDKKGQAAMEFIMTYGWAILAAVIAIAVLAYFGVFSPGRYIPNVCTINSPLGCDEYKIAATGIDLVIRNGAGDGITVSNVVISGCGSLATAFNIDYGGTSGKRTVTCSPNLNPGKFKGSITVTYNKTVGGAIDQTVTGSVSGVIQ